MPKKKIKLDKDSSDNVIVVKKDDGPDEPIVMFNFQLLYYVR